jgi:hypothetical protein
MCFRPEIVEPNWSYVGAGKGGYEKVETYNYVGEGAGSYDKDFFSQHVIFGWRPRSCCLCFCFSLGLLVLGTVFAPFLGYVWNDVMPDWLPWHHHVNQTIGHIQNGLGDIHEHLQNGLGDLHRHLHCSAAGENCTSTKCCTNTSMRCFEKDQHWAGCRTSCVPGIFEEDPPEHRSR